MTVENRIGEWMARRGLAESELAGLCGMDQGHLNRIKNGHVHPTLPTALRIAGGLGVRVREIFRLPGLVGVDAVSSQAGWTSGRSGRSRLGS
ncbi:MAG: helix-turn-helix transcriptional regulator [Deltaproteobacteria bacterium]